MLNRYTDPNLERFCQIALEAGLNPDLIPADDWKIDGDTIHYRYVLLEPSGEARLEDGIPLKTMWMTAKVGGGK